MDATTTKPAGFATTTRTQAVLDELRQYVQPFGVGNLSEDARWRLYEATKRKIPTDVTVQEYEQTVRNISNYLNL